jgi:hypothetical protein
MTGAGVGRPDRPGWYYATVAGEGVRPVCVTVAGGELVAWPFSADGWCALDDPDVEWIGAVPLPPGVDRWGR